MNTTVRRFKTHVMYALNWNSMQFRGTLFFLVLLGGLTAGAFVVERSIAPTAIVMAEAAAKRQMLFLVNQVTQETLQREQVTYDQFYSIQKDANGDIASIVSDTVRLNELKLNISLSIQQSMLNSDMREVGIPIGSLLPGYLFHARGPRIPVKLIQTGFFTVNVVERFESTGINQTKHSVALEVTGTVQAVIPRDSVPVSITTTVPVTNTIIVGKVPSFYLQK